MRALINFDDAPIFAIPILDGPELREGMLLEGPQGWGEFSPPADVDEQTSARWLTAAMEVGTVGWPDPVRGRVPIAVTVPAVDPARAHQIVTASGCATADVTVATRPGSLADDIARLEAVRDALGPGGAIRVDANGHWAVDTAVSSIAALVSAADGLDYVEQPCRTLDELAAVRRRVDVRVAADQSVRYAQHPLDVSRADAADIAVLTCAPLGGARRALRVAEVCELPCVVSSALETSVGLAAGLALAGALPELSFACGLGTRTLLAGDVVAPSRSLVPVDGHLPVAPMPAAPDLESIRRFAVTDADVIARWRHRLRAAVGTR
ncbi:enolase C-terminal domain-like protein [soil metagenome]